MNPADENENHRLTVVTVIKNTYDYNSLAACYYHNTPETHKHAYTNYLIINSLRYRYIMYIV